MDNFTTVYEITRQIDDASIDLIVGGSIAVIIGALFLVLRKRSKGWPMPFLGPLLVVIFGSILFLAGLVFLMDTFITANMLISAYKNGQFRVVEGEVHVLHTQPSGGHTKGDIIRINGQEFEVNFFVHTPAYSRTISHGGVLRQGTYARVYHQKGKILRIDIRNPVNMRK
jgi:hypothetical protein